MNEKNPNQSGKKTTAEDYLAAERGGVVRSEFIDGRVVERPESNRWHNLIVSNTAIIIGGRIQGHKCDIYISDMRVKFKNGSISYPDLVIVNGEPSFGDARMDLLLNPTVVIEIFSSNTDTAGKSRKLESFLELDSIKECLLIKQDEMRVEHYAKQNHKQWIYRIYNERDDVISLDSVTCKLSLQEIYAQIKLGHQLLSSTAAN
ncbi:MAG: Uma2 family endonuclease [Blastocatellia bacterium]|nr:Uma2 family endonuclease [Blastocatellia bacterium]